MIADHFLTLRIHNTYDNRSRNISWIYWENKILKIQLELDSEFSYDDKKKTDDHQISVRYT